MEKPNPNPSKDSTTMSPPSSPPSPFDHDDDVPPTPTNPITTEGNSEGKKRDEGRETILKTPVQVLDELSGGDGDGGQSGGPIGGSAAAVAVGGSMVVVEGSTTGGGSEGQVLKKRKNTQLKNPPSGIPTCPICKKEFATWKAAFGHMRKHPERNYRGFFKPPVFGASAAADQPPEGDGGDNSKGSEEMNRERGVVASLVRGLVFDLNQQWEEAGSSSGAAEPESAPAPAPESSTAAEDQDQEKMDVDQEGKKLGFDLNELPSDDDDEE